MKIPVLTFFLVISFSCFSQVQNFDSLLAKGKAEFKKDYNDQDYTAAVRYLEEAVAIDSTNSEAHYFLGYAYCRLNSKDGKSLIDMNLALVQKASAEFETVNRLSPEYTGELVVLDPYGKITSEWGCMAMSYWHNNKQDSAVWAFKQGRLRGGFDEFILTLNRSLLDFCTPNSILITSGDNFTIPLWYLQIVEQYRKDVSIFDISLLNTIWYPRYLTEKKIIQFDKAQTIIDTIQYCAWKEKSVKAGNFSWVVKPTYYNRYLLRSDILLLSILQKNNFARDVYFTKTFPSESKLSLTSYMKSYILVDRVDTHDQLQMPLESYKKEVAKLLQVVEKANMNSETDYRFMELIRFDVLDRMNSLLEVDNKEDARELKKLMEKYINEDKYPIKDNYMRSYADKILKQLN